TSGGAPATSRWRIANVELSRSAAYEPSATAIRPRPIASERRDGTSCSSRAGPTRGSGATAARARGSRACTRRRLATRPGSPPGRSLLPDGREVEVAEELHLVSKHDAVLLECTPARLGHQRDRIRGAGAVDVLDEVGVLRRDLRPADAMASQAARLEHP